MKRNFITALAVCYALSTSGLAFYAQQKGYFNQKDAVVKNQAVTTKVNADVKDIKNKQVTGTNEHKEEKSASSNNVISNSQKKTVQAPLSRGAVAKSKSDDANVSKSKKVEVLDWWKEAQFVFSVGTEAMVKDVYTGKTFKIVRTMGTNHADSEAVSKQDTQTIKDIWGGFSWERRPVLITIGGRVLAASMAGMPHAGLDAAPAYDVVNNRAGGFGRGQNLDVIKGNGMDGHFDVHFLNSKTHGTSKVDPQHQACIKIAAGSNP